MIASFGGYVYYDGIKLLQMSVHFKFYIQKKKGVKDFHAHFITNMPMKM